jgi:hypothetical protein
LALLDRRRSVLIEDSFGMAAHLLGEKPRLFAGRIRKHYLQAVRDAAS